MKEGLRVKVFRMNIIPIAVAVILFMILGILQVRRFAKIMEQTNQEQNNVILETVTDSMLDLTTENYQKYVISEARLLNSEFRTMRHDLEVLAKEAEMVLQQPSLSPQEDILPPSSDDAGKMTLQLLYSDKADRTDPDLQKQISQISTLGSMMLEIVNKDTSLIDCVISLEGGASILADNTPEKKIKANGKVKPFNCDLRPWYVGALVHDKTFFTPVNRDSFTGELQIMVGVPVYLNGRAVAVCGGSVRLEKMGEIVSDAQFGDYTDSCLINENGNLLYSSRSSGEVSIAENNLKSLKESSNADLVEVVNEAMKGNSGASLLMLDGKYYYAAYAPVETVGWSQLLLISIEDLYEVAYLVTQKTDSVMTDSLDDVRSNENRTIISTLIVAAILLGLATIVSMLFAKNLVRPIKRITLRVAEMQGEDMTFQLDDVMMTGDEIEVLAKAFENMSVQMKGYVSEIVKITSEKQRLDTELSVASAIQVNMLPTRFPAFPERKEFDLYAVMDPAKEVGGDFYDFFLIDDDHLAVVMADVSGKGVPAALFMVISKTLIKNIALSGIHSCPSQILADVNNHLCEGNEDNMFVTVWLGILTISTGRLVSSCAGHEYPVFYRHGNGFVLEKDPHGMAIGGFEGLRYKDVEWKVEPGDMLFLYTDGVPEANNSREELFGNDRMMDALNQSYDTVCTDDNKAPDLRRFLREVRKHIDDFAGDTPQFDDLTMLCMEYSGPEKKI